MQKDKCWICRRDRDEIIAVLSKKKFEDDPYTDFDSFTEDIFFDITGSSGGTGFIGFLKNKVKICGVCCEFIQEISEDHTIAMCHSGQFTLDYDRDIELNIVKFKDLKD